MFYRAFLLLLLVAFPTIVFAFPENVHHVLDNPKNGKLWAVLVAGSTDWLNYRHQADVCHSYQVLRNHGIPDERIIVMMEDDLANSIENPTPGILINHPKGKDVYKGVPKDYTGKAVTAKNFMAILKGNKKVLDGQGSGKVLKSGPNDHVFVYFADHGAPGLIAFPHHKDLSATELNQTIHYMYEKKMYGKMVFYIEACESGSMFENILSRHLNVYATTAANSDESSYACYYDIERGTFLGDYYSVNWLEDSDKEILTQETLHQQFKIVKSETHKSHVQEFGDLKIGQMHVSEFQGRKNAEPIILPKVEMDPVRSRDVPIEIVKRKYMKSNSVDDQAILLKKLNKMLRNRQFLSDKVSEIVTEIFHDQKQETDIKEKHYKLRNFECYDKIRMHFNEECFNLSKNDYALDFMYILVNLCEKGVAPGRSMMAMERVCIHPPVYGIL
ncbi:legumain [Trichonephila inaurata madagascariensis]|uniref:legumain n=1 Tax=Trichonephila inaurata madagascariensis TaxID=2747483 RepID=A0A8X6X1W6_9ARAC|nr:legumain [Trichonephila inaurata madagascariensis]